MRSGFAGAFGPDDLNALDIIGSPPQPKVPSSGPVALIVLAAGLFGLATVRILASRPAAR